MKIITYLQDKWEAQLSAVSEEDSMLRTLPSFALSAFKAVVMFVDRRQNTTETEKRENENSDKDFLNYSYSELSLW